MPKSGVFNAGPPLLAALIIVGLGVAAAPTGAQTSSWGVEAEEGVCTIAYFTGEEEPAGVADAHGLSWTPGQQIEFMVGGAKDWKKAEGEMAVRVQSASGPDWDGVAQATDGEAFRTFILSTPDRKDVSSLVAGDLTFIYANAGAVRRYTMPLAQQLPRIRNCMAQARAQAMRARATAAAGSAPTRSHVQAEAQPQAAPAAPPADKVLSTGSGVFVSASAHLLTNAHVVDGCRTVTAPGFGPAEVVAVDEASDLALLRFGKRPRGVVAIRPEGLRLGEAVLVAGYPLTPLLSGLNVTGGNVSALSGVQGDRRQVLITAPIQHGNSGGPVLDASGRLVALVAGSLPDEVSEITGAIPQNVNYAVAPFLISAFLQENGVSFSEGRRATLSNQAIADQAKAHTVLLQCRA